MQEEIIRPVLPAEWLNKETRYYINPAGRFVIGGPVWEVCGLTGKKTAVDTYGLYCPSWEAAVFLGKDPSKVDRSAAYVARYIARLSLLLK